MVNIRKKILWLPAALAILMTGCQSDNYYWGHYEDLIYISYAKPGKASPELQARTMEEDAHKAVAANKPLPPGFHAHLGYLYYQMGKTDLALQQFQMEKMQFPESAVFVDRMIASLSKK